MSASLDHSDTAIGLLLIAVSDNNWCEIVPISQSAPVTIGRAGSNVVTIHDVRCSRHHACISFHEGGWYLKDFNTSNGTWLNGHAINRPVQLTPGDRIRIADREFEVTSPSNLAAMNSAESVDSFDLSLETPT